jgi:hypothetical protein
MSFNRLKYDTCQTAREQNESVSVLSYVLNMDAYENPKKGRHVLGLVGGTGVSHIQGNLVDLESDLRGQTRFQTKCADRQWKPLESEGAMIRNDKTAPIDTRAKHLPAYQMFAYRAVPLPGPMELSQCRRG